MQKVQRFIVGWTTTFKQQGCVGKVILVAFSLLFLGFLCVVPLAILSPAPPMSEAVSTATLDIPNLQTAAVETAFAGVTETAMANVPTLTFTPSIEPPTFTATYVATSTLEQFLPVTSLGVPCVPSTTKKEEGLVAGIVDGDTIDVIINGQTFRVRYIGIDTPETNENLYWQATAINQDLVFNKEVLLITDVSETDRYGRLLRYVFVNSTFVNYELVRQGYAHASTYPPDVACSEYFANAQTQASSAQAGLWAPTSAAPVVVGGGNGSGGSNCDPSYPTVCIPPPPPDLDCPDIPAGYFQVLPPDPHRFDGDDDGIGCEN